MQPETTRDRERDRLVSTIVDFEKEARLVDEQIERIRAKLQAEEAVARDVRETLLGLQRQLERLERQSVADNLVLLPSPPPSALAPREPSFAPRREEGIMAILGRHPDRVWTYLELHDEFKRRGWDNPKAKKEIAAIRAAIYRLDKLGQVELGPGRGEFRYKLPPATTTPDTGAPDP